ncbi:MAG TPA: hypothetical protein VF529_14270 [Solirubrobacteraceae bacterium]
MSIVAEAPVPSAPEPAEPPREHRVWATGIQPGVEALDERELARTQLKACAAHLAWTLVKVGFVALVFTGVFGVLGASGLASALAGVATIAAIALAAMRFFAERADNGLAEGRAFVEGGADLGDRVLDDLAGSLVDRRVPADAIEVVAAGREGRRHLRVTRARFRIYVGATAFGEDLHIGWSMWWCASADELRGLAAGWWNPLSWFDLEPAGQGPRADVPLTRIDDAPKALRDAINSCMQDALDRLRDGLPLRSEGIVGRDVRVVEVGR